MDFGFKESYSLDSNTIFYVFILFLFYLFIKINLQGNLFPCIHTLGERGVADFVTTSEGDRFKYCAFKLGIRL